MKKTKMLMMFTVFAFSASFIFANPALAKDKTTAELQKQIDILQKRVDELETEKKQPLGFMMPEMNKAWNAFDEMQKMQEEMNQVFQDSFKQTEDIAKGAFSNNMSYEANFEMKDQKDKYVLEVDMKGFDQDKTKIEVSKQYVTVKGEQSTEKKQESDNSYAASKSFSSFMRTIPLPKDADTSKMKSDKQGDKLIIAFPKKK